MTEPTNGPDLLQRLRDATRPAHAALEREMGLLSQIPSRAGMRALLGRFHGFHAASEPALEAALADDQFLLPRRRLDALRQDLMALGVPPEQIAALPRPALPDLQPPGAALGLLYVMEGSTLGGQMIARHLKAATWLPPLRFFAGHGKQTAALWRETCARLQAVTDSAAQRRAIATAVASFDLLRLWLCEADQLA